MHQNGMLEILKGVNKMLQFNTDVKECQENSWDENS